MSTLGRTVGCQLGKDQLQVGYRVFRTASTVIYSVECTVKLSMVVDSRQKFSQFPAYYLLLSIGGLVQNHIKNMTKISSANGNKALVLLSYREVIWKKTDKSRSKVKWRREMERTVRIVRVLFSVVSGLC